MTKISPSINNILVEQVLIKMEYPQWFEDFVAMTTTSTGKIISKAVNEKYFNKNGKQELWSTFLSNTEHLSHLIPSQRIKYLKEGLFFELPKCYCNRPISFVNGTLSKYCSGKCWLSSPERKVALKEQLSKYNREEANNKRKVTMLSKYGSEFNSQRQDIHHMWKLPKVPQEIAEKLYNKEWMHNEYVVKERTSRDISNELGVNYSTVLWHCFHHGFKIRRNINRSTEEIEICNFISSCGYEYEISNTEIAEPFEVDIVIHSKMLAIEVDGLYWHNSEYKDKRYHIRKSQMCYDNGYRLFHITDYEWNTNRDNMKSKILSILNGTEIVNGRLDLMKDSAPLDINWDKITPTYYWTDGNTISKRRTDIHTKRFFTCGRIIHK